MLSLFKECFSVNLNEYENIGINLEINKVIVLAFAAMIVGIVLFNMYRQNIKLVVSQLIRHGAVSEESAKTLNEIGLKEHKAAKRMLLGDNLLTRIVDRCGKKRYEYDEYKALSKEEKERISTVDFSEARFYIKKEQRAFAEGVVSNYGTSLMNTVISCVFAVVICVCLIACMPGILNIINRML